MVNFPMNSSSDIFKTIKRVRSKPKIKALPNEKQKIFLNLASLKGNAYQKELSKVKML